MYTRIQESVVLFTIKNYTFYYFTILVNVNYKE